MSFLDKRTQSCEDTGCSRQRAEAAPLGVSWAGAAPGTPLLVDVVGLSVENTDCS